MQKVSANAQASLQQAIAIARATENFPSEAKALGNLGQLFTKNQGFQPLKILNLELLVCMGDYVSWHLPSVSTTA